MRWSKSRVEGQFLVYRQIETETSSEAELESTKRRRLSSVDSVSAGSTVGDDDTLTEEDRYQCSKDDIKADIRSENASLKREFRPDSVLCKKTFAISIDGNVSHVVIVILIKICYYSKEDVNSGLLKTPSSMDMFQDVHLPDCFLNPSNFRLHPKGTTPLKHNMDSQKSSSAKNEVRGENYIRGRYVTVHRLGDPQALKISISNDFKVFIN